MGRGPARTDLKLRAADLLQQTQTVSTGTNGGRALRRWQESYSLSRYCTGKFIDLLKTLERLMERLDQGCTRADGAAAPHAPGAAGHPNCIMFMI